MENYWINIQNESFERRNSRRQIMRICNNAFDTRIKLEEIEISSILDLIETDGTLNLTSLILKKYHWRYEIPKSVSDTKNQVSELVPA